MANNSAPRLSSFDLLQDYEQRSLLHAPGRPEMIEAAGHWRGVGYRLGKRRFVSSFDEIVEIITLPGVTPVPGANPWMLGVANVRGNLIPVVDLKQFLEGDRTVVHDGQRVLVIRHAINIGSQGAVCQGKWFGWHVCLVSGWG